MEFGWVFSVNFFFATSTDIGFDRLPWSTLVVIKQLRQFVEKKRVALSGGSFYGVCFSNCPYSSTGWGLIINSINERRKKSNMYSTSHNFLGHLIRAKPHCGVRNMSIKTFLHPNLRGTKRGCQNYF